MTKPTIKQSPLLCRGHTRPVVDVCYSGEDDAGSLFITAAKDGKAILRHGITGDWIGTFLGHNGAVWSCVLDMHGTKAATGAADFTAKLWDVDTGNELLSIAEDHIVRCVDFSKVDSGAHLLTATNRKKLSVYDLSNPDQPSVRLDAHKQIIRRALWCNDDRCIMTASEDKTVCLWDLSDRTEKPVQIVPLWSKELPQPVLDMKLDYSSSSSSLGQVRSAVVYGQTVELYTLDWRHSYSQSPTQPPTATHTLPCPIASVDMHPTENFLVCGGEDHSVYRLDGSTGEVLENCKGHFGPVHCVRFSPGGQVIASGSEDGTVRLWQVVVGTKFGLWDLVLPSATVKENNPAHSIQPETEVVS